jgi:hypothetical protein
MMRKGILLLSAGMVLSTTMATLADDSKPRAILSLASQDKVKMATEEVSCIKEAPGAPTWMSSFFELYARGGEVSGLSSNRPWGIVLEGTEEFTGYAFVPVTDVEDLRYDLEQYISSTIDEGNGIYKVVGAQPGKELYARESGGWLFVSDCVKVLENVGGDPSRMIEGMDKTYDVAVRLALKSLPAKQGRQVLDGLDKTVGATLRKATSNRAVELLGEAAMKLEEVTIGWGKH